MKFLIKIFSHICLYVSLLLLVYVFYKSQIYWNGQKNNLYFGYYIFSIILILFSILSFYFNDKFKEYLIITLTSVIITLYIFEGYITLNSEKEKIYEISNGIKYDKRTKYQVYEDLKKKKSNISVSVAPSNHLNEKKDLMPLSGISNVETIYCNENGYFSIYKSDRYGFNNPDKEWTQKNIDFVLVGDSFAQGACVNRPDDIGSVLRTLSKKAVLNLGQGGNGPLIKYATLREYLNSNVKNILWLYFEGNDIENLNKELKNEILINYFQNTKFSQNLRSEQKQINTILNKMINQVKVKEKETANKQEKPMYKIFKFLKVYKTRSLFFALPKIQPEFKSIIEKVKKLSDDNNSKLYFVYLPESRRYKSNLYLNRFFSYIRYKRSYLSVKKVINELNIPFIDIHEELFKKSDNPLKFFPLNNVDSHYNVEGYKNVAKTIYQIIKD